MLRLLLLILIVTESHFSYAQLSSAQRLEEPVILRGEDAISFLGQDPDMIVGFKFFNFNWVQIPVQIDERTFVDILEPYGPAIVSLGVPYPSGYNVLLYTDSKTFTGSDPDSLFDSDDEIVFLAGDAAEFFNSDFFPQGVIPQTARAVTISDPLQSDTAFVYLFIQDGTLDQSAGVNYVSYNFNLTSGNYINSFDLINGPNPEQSTVTSANYQLRFLDRWILDDLKIYSGSASGQDILDRQQFFFTPGNCVRTEETFANGPGCHVAIIDGPVRSIRSCMGANSGPLTQQSFFLYRSRVDIETNLRVHTISSLHDVLDFETTATGMTNWNNLNTGGLTIDGVPELANTGELDWELIAGPHGSILISHDVETDINLATEASLISYWEDQVINPISDCTGDNLAYGTHGWGIDFVTAANICTDPLFGVCTFNSPNFRKLTSYRRMLFRSPGATSNAAALFHLKALSPLLSEVDTIPLKLNCNTQIGFAKVNVSCAGLLNGQINTFITGANPPFGILWSTGDTNQSISNLYGGVYTISVTDNIGCEKLLAVNVFEPDPVTVFSLINNPGPGDVNLLVTGGIAPFSFNWSTGATSEDVAGLSPGIYFVQVIDRNGCAMIHMVTVF